MVREVTPSDYKVNHVSLDIQGINGENTLLLKGSGDSDGFGITVDNVVLMKESIENTS